MERTGVMSTALGLLLFLGVASAHSYHSGDCPVVKAMPNFKINQFLGEWHVIQKTKSSARCLVNTYTRDGEAPNSILLEQSSLHAVLGLTAKDGRYRYTGVLSPKENATSPADMTVNFKLNVAGSAHYAIVLTDYNTYAGVISCQDLPIGYRLSASVLSRRNELDGENLVKVRASLAANGVNVEDLENLEQDLDDCAPPKPGEGFHGAVQRAGDAINTGVQAIKDGAKKLYDKVRGADTSTSQESSEIKVPQRPGQIDQDAEWLP